MKKIKNGFSLIELILYGALLSVFLVVMTDLFVTSLDVKLESEATSATEQDGRYILSKFISESSQADDVLVPINIGDTSDQLQVAINGQVHTFFLANGDLMLTDASTSARMNSSETTISNVTFERIGNESGKNSIRIAFVVTSVTQRNSGPETRSFQTSIGLR